MKQHDDTVTIAVTYSPENKRGNIEAFFPGEDRDDRDARAESLHRAIIGCVMDELEDEGVGVLGGGPIDHPSKVQTPGLSLSSLADAGVQDLGPDDEPGPWEIDATGRAFGTDDDIPQA